MIIRASPSGLETCCRWENRLFERESLSCLHVVYHLSAAPVLWAKW